MRRGGSRHGKAAMGKRAGAAQPCWCSGHRDACTGWPSPLPTSHKRGSPAPRGWDTSLLDGAAPCHVCASESSSRPSFPSRYLARSLRVTMPTTCRERERYSPTLACRAWGQGQCPPKEPRLPTRGKQGLTSLRLSTTTKCRSPRARKSLNTRGRDASCKAERAGLCGLRHPQLASSAHP